MKRLQALTNHQFLITRNNFPAPVALFAYASGGAQQFDRNSKNGWWPVSCSSPQSYSIAVVAGELTWGSMMAGEKILILEDDPDVASVYARALRLDGNDVTVCTGFEEARQQLKSVHPDAVLTDVRVGKYNGLQLALLFRTYSPQGRVVVITGWDDTVIRKEVEQLDGEFILKPINISQLRNAFGSPNRASKALTH